LLEVSRPTSFARAGKLNPRQVERKLKGRRKTVTSLEELGVLIKQREIKKARSIKAEINKMNTKELRRLVAAVWSDEFRHLFQTKKSDDAAVANSQTDNEVVSSSK
jgi:hypothetical protein